jgi:cell division protease FtsH
MINLLYFGLFFSSVNGFFNNKFTPSIDLTLFSHKNVQPKLGIFVYIPKNYSSNNNFIEHYKRLIDDDNKSELHPEDYFPENDYPQNDYPEPNKNSDKIPQLDNKQWYKRAASSGFKKASESGFEVIKNSDFNFKNVGGYNEVKEELYQVSDMLTNYKKYKQFNVRLPKGLVLEGPPGNGKTLIAKAFAGESNTSFIPVSGSDFVEKYVGVGALRIRELFKLASENLPAIIFIDEIDAIGRQRGDTSESSSSERDQALNQLLVKLDGFKSTDGIFLMGATNRFDLLDKALTRPGRIDKHIYVGNPDDITRKEIVKIHLMGKPLDEEVKLEYIQYLTDGFSGAQIENLLNEAMLYALRNDRTKITKYDLDIMTNKIMSGTQSSTNNFSNDTIERIIIHELGHAIVGFFSENHAKVSRVCLSLNSPTSPGYTIFETSSNGVLTKESLEERLAVLLGGRIAEEIFFGASITTGAKKDLYEAHELAKNMITIYGMGKKKIYPTLSDKSKSSIDNEIIELIDKVEKYSYSIIKQHTDVILKLSPLLKEYGILKYDDIYQVVHENNE